MARSNDRYQGFDTLHLQSHTVMYPLTKQPITAPRRVIWEYLALEHHQQPPGECAYSLPYHTIRIALQPYHPFERRSNDERLLCFSVTRGDLAFCPASSHQWMRWLANAEFLLLHLHPILFVRLAEEVDLASDSIELLEYEEEIQDPLLLQIGLALQAELSEDTATFSAIYVEALANALGAHLLKRYCRQTGRKSATFPPAEQFSPTTWRHIVEYIQEHLDHSLTLDELAKVVGMSPYHFARRFKQSRGLTPHQYILHARIECARTLLLEEEPIIELVTRLGFADQSHFTRTFKHFVGMTPGAFIQQYRKHLLPLSTFEQNAKGDS
jgi:AraC family transcriptional regulator